MSVKLIIFWNSKLTLFHGICHCCLHIIETDNYFPCIGYHILFTKPNTLGDSRLPEYDYEHLRLRCHNHSGGGGGGNNNSCNNNILIIISNITIISSSLSSSPPLPVRKPHQTKHNPCQPNPIYHKLALPDLQDPGVATAEVRPAGHVLPAASRWQTAHPADYICPANTCL